MPQVLGLHSRGGITSARVASKSSYQKVAAESHRAHIRRAKERVDRTIPRLATPRMTDARELLSMLTIM